jgi:hypothetical protein
MTMAKPRFADWPDALHDSEALYYDEHAVADDPRLSYERRAVACKIADDRHRTRLFVAASRFGVAAHMASHEPEYLEAAHKWFYGPGVDLAGVDLAGVEPQGRA